LRTRSLFSAPVLIQQNTGCHVQPSAPQVEEATVLWISRAVFEHLRPSTLTSWQAGRVVDNHAALEAGLLAAIQVKLEAASPSTVEHVKTRQVRAWRAGREVRDHAALAADLSAQASAVGNRYR